MSRRAKSELSYLAPGASQGVGAETAKVWLPGASDGAAEVPSPGSISPNGGKWPAPDEHLVEPETGREMLGGRVMEVAPADAPHADQQCDLAYVLRAHVAPGYVASTELLTRVSDDSNFSSDACIRREGLDAEGHRYLEELSFEVQHTQSEASLSERARYLRERGVRRVIAIEVKMAGKARLQTGRLASGQLTAGPVKEWVQAPEGSQLGTGHWRQLAADELFEDRCLYRPVKVAALVNAVEADNAVARALMARKNPALLAMRQQSFDKGHEQGFDEGIEQGQIRGETAGNRRAVEVACNLLGIVLTPGRRAKLDALDSDEIERLLVHLQTNKKWDDSLD